MEKSIKEIIEEESKKIINESNKLEEYIEVEPAEIEPEVKHRFAYTYKAMFATMCVLCGIFIDLFIDAKLDVLNKSDMRGYINLFISMIAAWVLYTGLKFIREFVGEWEG